MWFVLIKYILQEVASAMEDPWEFLDPVDVISKLDAKFTELIESKKWAERKEALETFHKLLVDNPRLDPKQNYNENVELLKRVSKTKVHSCT